MDTNTPLQARLLDRRPDFARRALRVRVIGQSAALVAIATLVLAVAALAGCGKDASAGAQALPEIASESDSPPVAAAGGGKVRYGFDWREADKVIYVEGDWPDESDRPVEY